MNARICDLELDKKVENWEKNVFQKVLSTKPAVVVIVVVTVGQQRPQYSTKHHI